MCKVGNKLGGFNKTPPNNCGLRCSEGSSPGKEGWSCNMSPWLRSRWLAAAWVSRPARGGGDWTLVGLPLGCSFLLSFWQSSPVGQRLVTGPYRSAGKTGKCALQLGSHVALNLRVPLLKNRKTHGGIHKKCPVLQAVISGFIVSTLTILHIMSVLAASAVVY